MGQILTRSSGQRRARVSDVRVLFRQCCKQGCTGARTDEQQRVGGPPYPEVAGSNPVPATKVVSVRTPDRYGPGSLRLQEVQLIRGHVEPGNP